MQRGPIHTDSSRGKLDPDGFGVNPGPHEFLFLKLEVPVVVGAFGDVFGVRAFPVSPAGINFKN